MEHFEYDSFDQLIRVRFADSAGFPSGKVGEDWTATYDGLGRRIEFGRGEAKTKLYWEGDRLAAEVSPTGTLRLYGYAADHALLPYVFIDYASVDAPLESGKSYYPFTDPSGLPIRIEDASGEPVWTAHQTDVYGAITVKPLPYYRQCDAIEYRLRWPGHYFDPELGLHLNRYRDYDPQLGRYIEPDPLGHAGGINLYAYCRDPIGDVDLLGLHPQNRANAVEGADSRSTTEGDGNAHLQSIADRARDGGVIPEHVRNNPDGYRYDRERNRYVAVGDQRPTVRSDSDNLDVPLGAELDPSRPDVAAALAARESARRTRDRESNSAREARARGDEEGALAHDRAENDASQEMRQQSKALGEMAADTYLDAAYPGSTDLPQRDGRDRFDRVRTNPDPPPPHVIAEAKGGAATNSSSRGANDGTGRRYQQGTTQYRESVGQAMARDQSADARTQALGRTVASAGHDDVHYIEITQPINDDGTLAPMRAVRYRATSEDTPKP